MNIPDSLLTKLAACKIQSGDADLQEVTAKMAAVFNEHGMLSGNQQIKYIDSTMRTKRSKLYDHIHLTASDDQPSLMGYALAKQPPIRKLYWWNAEGVRESKNVYQASKQELYDELHRYDLEGPIPETPEDVYQQLKVSGLKDECGRRGLDISSKLKKTELIALIIEDDDVDPRIEELWSRPYCDLRQECGVAGMDIETGHFKQAFVDYLLKRTVKNAEDEEAVEQDIGDINRKTLYKWCISKKLDPKSKDPLILRNLAMKHRDGAFYDEIHKIQLQRDKKRKKAGDY